MAADGIERSPAKGAVGADRLDCAVSVHRRHHRTVKLKGLLGGAFGHAVFSDVAIGLHDLHISHPGIIEVRHDGIEKLRHWHVVGIEDHDQFPPGLAQGVVDVARLGIFMRGPGHMMDTQFRANALEIGIIRLVAQPTFMGIANRLDRLERPDDHRIGLAGAKSGEDIDAEGRRRGRGRRNGDGQIMVPLEQQAQMGVDQSGHQQEIKRGIPDYRAVQEPPGQEQQGERANQDHDPQGQAFTPGGR